MEKTLVYKEPTQDDLSGIDLMLSAAKTYVIDSNDMAVAAAEDLKLIKGKFKQLDELRKSITAPMDLAKKNVMELFRRPLDQLSEAEDILKASIMKWQIDEQRKADEYQRQLKAEAEAERKRLEKEALEAAKDGRQEEAEEILQQAAMQVTHAPAPESQKLEGVTVRKTWKARVINKADFIKAAAENQALQAFIIVDEQALSRYAASLKGNTNIPGIEAYEFSTVGARSA